MMLAKECLGFAPQKKRRATYECLVQTEQSRIRPNLQEKLPQGMVGRVGSCLPGLVGMAQDAVRCETRFLCWPEPCQVTFGTSLDPAGGEGTYRRPSSQRIGTPA